MFNFVVCNTYSENDKQFIDFTCSVCTVKYRSDFVFLVLKNLSPIFHGTNLVLNNPLFFYTVSTQAMYINKKPSCFKALRGFGSSFKTVYFLIHPIDM